MGSVQTSGVVHRPTYWTSDDVGQLKIGLRLLPLSNYLVCNTFGRYRLFGVVFGR